MVFRKFESETEQSAAPLIIDAGSTIDNQGSICLQKVHLLTFATIGGEGCITVGSGSVLDMIPQASNEQTIFLERADSGLKIAEPGALSSIPHLTIAGFGDDNVIEFDFEVSSNFGYSPDAGLLSIQNMQNLLTIHLGIGLGYERGAIELTLNSGSSKLTYSKPPPLNIRPPKCNCVPDVSGRY